MYVRSRSCKNVGSSQVFVCSSYVYVLLYVGVRH